MEHFHKDFPSAHRAEQKTGWVFFFFLLSLSFESSTISFLSLSKVAREVLVLFVLFLLISL